MLRDGDAREEGGILAKLLCSALAALPHLRLIRVRDAIPHFVDGILPAPMPNVVWSPWHCIATFSSVAVRKW